MLNKLKSQFRTRPVQDSAASDQNEVTTSKRMHMPSRRTILLVLLTIVIVGGSAAWIYIKPTPQYSLYRLNKAALEDDTATFAAYYRVKHSGPNADQETDQQRLEAFKEKYTKELNLIEAFTKTDLQNETINVMGTIIFVRKGNPELAFRMERQEGIWIVADEAILQ